MFHLVGLEMATLESLQFDLATIIAATNRFSDQNKIGKGGFGEVYKVSKCEKSYFHIFVFHMNNGLISGDIT